MIEQSLIISLLVLSIWYCCQEGEIFGFMQRFYHWKIAPALFECNVCMSPWYGTPMYWLIPWEVFGFAPSSLIGWPIVVICAMGINAAINKLSPDKSMPSEKQVVEEMDMMCAGSLPPTYFEWWEKIKRQLSVTRKELKTGSVIEDRLDEIEQSLKRDKLI